MKPRKMRKEKKIIRKITLSALCFLGGLFLSPRTGAEEWYIPRQSYVAGRGTWEAGTRFQLLIERNGIDFDRRMDFVGSLRYAPTRRIQFTVEAPHVLLEQQRAIFPATLRRIRQEGWGDVYSQVSFDLLGREDWKLALNGDFIFPTGRNPWTDNRDIGGGFYKVAPGLTYVKIIDPAALFFYVGQQWTIPREFAGTGKVAPGKDLRFRAGLSLLLHPRLRATVYTAGDIIARTEIKSVKVGGTDADIVRFGGGFDWSVTDQWSLEWNAAFGATANASDAVMSLGVTRSFR